jgi:hypothetical protein
MKKLIILILLLTTTTAFAYSEQECSRLIDKGVALTKAIYKQIKSNKEIDRKAFIRKHLGKDENKNAIVLAISMLGIEYTMGNMTEEEFTIKAHIIAEACIRMEE